MNEEEKKAVEIVNSLKEWGKIHFIVKDRCHARLTYNEVYLLLTIIEKLQKENEKLKNKLLDTLEGQKVIEEETPQYIKENYIPTQKIKDKIEELNSRIEKYREYVEQGIETDVEWVDNVADRKTVKVLQELIEEREEK